MSLPQHEYTDDELEALRDDPCELMRETAKRMLARRRRRQAETDEAKARLYDPKAQQAKDADGRL